MFSLKNSTKLNFDHSNVEYPLPPELVFTRGFKVKNLFAYWYKEKFPLKCRSMLVYYTECSVCGPSQAYLGKTKNSVYVHLGTWHLTTQTIWMNQRSFNFGDSKIVETWSSDEQIRFIESILLNHDKQTLNTQDGSIKLNV